MATLKISDLSVGDWVHHDFYEVDMRVVTVYGDTERIIAESNDGYGVTCHLDHFSPILITPEILEANGIYKTYECDEYAVYKGEGFGITEYYTDLWGFESRRNRVTIKRIHQLQHALRLAGVEKEIIMPNK